MHTVTILTASVVERTMINCCQRPWTSTKWRTSPSDNLHITASICTHRVADALLVVGVVFIFNQAPESMKSLGTSLSLTATGDGNFLGSFLLSVVSYITKRDGKGCVLDNLDASHLDHFYGFLTVLSALNLVFFLYVSKIFTRGRGFWKRRDCS